jgi:methionyl-tRNA formyltransferase
LEHGVKQFLCRLEDHPQIELAGGFFQSEAQDFSAVVGDLWRRRHFMTVPLLGQIVIERSGHYLRGPRQEIALNRQISDLAGKFHFIPDIHAPEVLEMVQALKPDLGLIYGSPILKPELFEIPVFGTLGIHHGKVPKYRGKKTTFWAMYNGEETAGVTIQKVNAGLDTGQIVQEGEVPIGNLSRGALWRELEPLGFDLYIKAILQVRDGTATYRPQTGPKGKLYYDPSMQQVLTLWWRQWQRRLGVKKPG